MRLFCVKQTRIDGTIWVFFSHRLVVANVPPNAPYLLNMYSPVTAEWPTIGHIESQALLAHHFFIFC